MQKSVSSQAAFFALSGSASVKAAHRMLVKLTPDLSLYPTFSSSEEEVENHQNFSFDFMI